MWHSEAQRLHLPVAGQSIALLRAGGSQSVFCEGEDCQETRATRFGVLV